MPGISITLNKGGETYINPITDDFPNYKWTVLEDNQFLITGFCPENYPIQVFEYKEFKIIIEGHLFSEKLLLKSELQVIAQNWFFDNNDLALKQFVKNTDGEYIICIIEKKHQQMIVFNDYLGRLPFYYYQSDKALLLSREISFLVKNTKASICKTAKAELLLFGFPLGNKTLHENCHKLLPSQALTVNKAKELKTKQIFEHNFDEENTDIGFDDAVKQSTLLFKEATKLRAKASSKHLLSLSGGLDSRALLASLTQSDIKYNIITYDDGQASSTKDIDVAKTLAKTFDTQLDLHKLGKASTEDSDLLIKIKQGLNYSGMSFLVPFFKQINTGNPYFWTGDGGDKIFPDLRPLRHIYSLNDLVNYIYKKHHNFNYDEIEKQTSISKPALKQHLKTHLQQYPEQSLSGKYIHFIVMERAVNWLFEGEDRNRYFVQSITPFYAIPLFQFCMSLPNKYKKDFKLFAHFLGRLNPKLNQIDNANWDTTITNTKKVKWIYFKQKVKSYLSMFRTFENTSPKTKEDYLNSIIQ